MGLRPPAPEATFALWQTVTVPRSGSSGEAENGGYADRGTALLFPIVTEVRRRLKRGVDPRQPAGRHVDGCGPPAVLRKLNPDGVRARANPNGRHWRFSDRLAIDEYFCTGADSTEWQVGR